MNLKPSGRRIYSAELLGAANELGSIELGKTADFVILSANPIKDISNMRKIEHVVIDGKIVYSDR